MNKLRKIYYPILAVLLIALIVFSALSVTVNMSTPFISTSAVKANAEKIAASGNYDAMDDILSTSGSSDRYNVVTEINKTIRNTLETKYKAIYDTNGATKSYTSTASSNFKDIVMGQYVVTDEDGKEEKKYELAPAYYSMSVTVDQDDLNAIPNAYVKGYYKGMSVRNIVLYVPGSQTKSGLARSAQANNYTFTYDEDKLADVVMMVAHYDSNVGDNGYTNNSVTVGTMLALLGEIVNGDRSYKNDILMVFTDLSYSGLGLEMFMNSPEYADLFGDARERVKSVAVFDNVGSVSTIVASQAKGSDTVSVFATAGDWYHSGSFSGSIASANVGGKEFNAVNGVSAIEILGVGNKSEITTAQSLSDSTIARVASVIGSFADRFGNANLGVLDNDAIIGFYSYVGLNFWYASYVSYIIGAIILIIVGLTVWFLIKSRAFNTKKAGLGAAVSALSLVATVATVTVLYLLVVLLLSLFGTVSVFAIGSLVSDNVWFFILAFVVSLVFLTVYNVIFRNVFKVKSLDVVRGNAWLIMLVAVVMCFAFPTYSYLFAGLAIAQGAAMLISILFKDKFKNKFGFDIERLLLYGASAIVLAPVVFAEALVVYSVSPAILLPLILSIVLVYAQSVTPYVLIIKDLYGVSTKKATAENTEESKPKTPLISNKTIAFTAIFTIVVYAATLVVGLLSASNNGLAATQSVFYGNNSIYNNAFVYEYNDINGKTSRSILLKDLDLYSYMKSDLTAFEWNVNRNAYCISDSTDVSNLPVAAQNYEPYYRNSTSKLFKFNTDNLGNDIRLGEKCAMTITFSATSGDTISVIRILNDVSTLTTTENQSASRYDEIVVNGSEVTVTIPSGYGKDLAIEVFATAKKSVPLVDIKVKVNAVYVAGSLDKPGDLATVVAENNVLSKLNSKYSNSKIVDNIYFVFEYNYEDTVKVPADKW